MYKSESGGQKAPKVMHRVFVRALLNVLVWVGSWSYGVGGGYY